MPEMDTAPKVVQPPLPSIDVQTNIAIPDNPALPNFGMSDSTNVKLASGGNGSGMGLGNGHGNGIGNGSGGNIGGGVYRVGGGVTAPTILRSVQAEFSDEARRNKYQGLCVIEIIVDEHGNPHNPHIVQALGEGLDENAVKAIMQYKFRPGMKDGKPVAVGPVDIEINFRLF
jgi:TonB family protein